MVVSGEGVQGGQPQLLLGSHLHGQRHQCPHGGIADLEQAVAVGVFVGIGAMLTDQDGASLASGVAAEECHLSGGEEMQYINLELAHFV